MTMPTNTSLSVQQEQDLFKQITADAISYAKKIGASDAIAEVAQSSGLSVSVRNHNVETVEQMRDRGLSITVYKGNQRGSASTSDFSTKAIQETVKAAWHIANYTAQDPAAALPEQELFAKQFPDLQLYHPWALPTEQAIQIAQQAEQSALQYSNKITNSEGASVNTHQGNFILANTNGFVGGYPTTRHSISVVPIASEGKDMQRDYWYEASRRWSVLQDVQQIGRTAAKRSIDRLGAKRIKTGQYPILFEAPLALGLLGSLVQAVSGGALYRKASFLLDSLGNPVFADHINVLEDPFIRTAMGSSVFDSEGVATKSRTVVDAGVLQGYFLSSYTARKLGMQTTGNAGGSHNLQLTSSLTNANDDLAVMLRKMDTGLLVTELIGQGINYVTGDYSRGAFGYWVENGEIAYPVQEITIAGNLADMFKQIVAVGSDVITKGSKTTGSILIEKMSVAGI